jgi:putative chitinase
MNIPVSAAQLLSFATRPAPGYAAAFGDAQAVFDRYGISASGLRLAHFMAQVLHESGGLRVETENLNYHAHRLAQVWPQRFLPVGPLDPRDYAMNPEKLANSVYGGRMGNSAPDDGFTYRGRGLLQVTGKDSYSNATSVVRASVKDAPDFVAAPEQVLAPAWGLIIAAAEWEHADCNYFADMDNLARVTRAINGGHVGLHERAAWLRLTKRHFLPRGVHHV